MITIEEGSISGFASHVMQFLTLEGEQACFVTSIKGAGSTCMHCLLNLCLNLANSSSLLHTHIHTGLLDGGLKFRPMCMPDRFIEHGDYRDQLNEAGLTPGHIAGTALQVGVCICLPHVTGRCKPVKLFHLSHRASRLVRCRVKHTNIKHSHCHTHTQIIGKKELAAKYSIGNLTTA